MRQSVPGSSQYHISLLQGLEPLKTRMSHPLTVMLQREENKREESTLAEGLVWKQEAVLQRGVQEAALPTRLPVALGSHL